MMMSVEYVSELELRDYITISADLGDLILHHTPLDAGVNLKFDLIVAIVD